MAKTLRLDTGAFSFACARRPCVEYAHVEHTGVSRLMGSPTAQRLGAKLRERRVAAGMSQREFAVLVGATQSAVSLWESGDRSLDVDMVVAAMRLLGGTADEWLGVA